MKRLTNEECIQDMIEASKGVRTKDSAETWLRLAEIENILGDDYDLDRLKVMVNQCMTMRQEVNERFGLTKYIPVDRLKEIVEAEKDQRCVILPHRLDVQEVFIIEDDDQIACIETFGEITIGQNIQGEFTFFYDGIMYTKEEFGKEIYTSYEDAEKELKERNEKHD